MNSISIFHPYGFIIGIAAITAIYLIQKKSKTSLLEIDDSTVFLALVGGLIGARLWHVMTDFYIYKNNIIGIFQIWQGGLSIIGGVIGGILMLVCIAKIKKINTYHYLDLAVFGVPIGQAIGRIGNYVNQELYGIPTQLPWKLYIEPLYRTTVYKNIAHYHPLFLYELILTSIFAIWIWVFDTRNQTESRVIINSGWYFYMYLCYYSIGRLLLDFLRVQKTIVFGGVGFNQLFLLFIAVYSSIQLKKIYYAKNKTNKT